MRDPFEHTLQLRTIPDSSADLAERIIASSLAMKQLAPLNQNKPRRFTAAWLALQMPRAAFALAVLGVLWAGVNAFAPVQGFKHAAEPYGPFLMADNNSVSFSQDRFFEEYYDGQYGGFYADQL